MSEKTKSISYYSVRTYEGNTSTFRQLSAERITDLIDRSLTLYKQTWKIFPDVLEITHKTTRQVITN